MSLRRRDLLKLGGTSALLGPQVVLGAASCATPGASQRTFAPRQRVEAWNRVMLASPGDLDVTGVVDGTIPEGLREATYVQNGPGKLTYGQGLAHPFDGHGYLRRFRFEKDGSVSLRARFVKTPVFEAEEKAGRIVYPGIGTLPDPGPDGDEGVVRNVANTTVVPWNGRYLAGYEGGSPFAVDEATLETLGEETFGVLEGATLAHMRIDPVAGRLVTLSPTMGMSTVLHFRELGTDGALLAERKVELDGVTFAHDFVITPSHYILAKNPLNFSLWGFAKAQMGFGTLIEAIAADADQAGALLLVPRHADAPVREVSVGGPAFVVHFVNAYESGSDVVIDFCAMPDFVFGNEFGFRGAEAKLDPGLPDQRRPQRVFRATIGVKETEARVSTMAKLAMDFPRVLPEEEGTNTGWAVAATRADERFSDPFDAVAGLDLVDLEREEDVWAPGQHRFVGEPVFLSGADGRSHAIAMVYDGVQGSSTLCIFDAKNISAGPQARVRFPLLPYAFHGWLQPPATTT